MWKKWILINVVLLVVAGCVTSLDPETGATLYSLDPNVVTTIEPLVEGGLTIGVILATLFPGISIITSLVTLATGIFGTWRKLKPQVTKAQDRATLMHTGVTSLVVAIEELKKASPESWEKLKNKIKVGPEIENIILAIRGLPPKI